MSAADFPLTYIDPVCHKPAFHRTCVPKREDTVEAKAHQHLDGTPMKPTNLVQCESCRRLFEPHDLPDMTIASNWRAREE